MTTQRQERLYYRGREYPLLDQPLAASTDVWTTRRLERLQMASTALGRGYLGTWAVRRGRLYLDELHATVREHSSPTNWVHGERGLDWLFPGSDGPVFAEWFSGELRAGVGGPARHLYHEEWPRHRVFDVTSGTVTRSELVCNRAAYAKCKADARSIARYLDGL